MVLRNCQQEIIACKRRCDELGRSEKETVHMEEESRIAWEGSAKEVQRLDSALSVEQVKHQGLIAKEKAQRSRLEGLVQIVQDLYLLKVPWSNMWIRSPQKPRRWQECRTQGNARTQEG